MTMSTATSRPRLKRLNEERNPGACAEKKIQKPMTMTSSPSCADAPVRFSRRRAGSLV